jgi:hypothetical protein
MDERRFDAMTRGIARGVARRRLLHWMGGGVIGALAAARIGMRPAAAKPDSRCPASVPRETTVSNSTCPFTAEPPIPHFSCDAADPGCFCVLDVNGDRRCVSPVEFPAVCPKRDRCDRNSDCPTGKVCAKVGGCCGHKKRNACLTLCLISM